MIFVFPLVLLRNACLPLWIKSFALYNLSNKLISLLRENSRTHRDREITFSKKIHQVCHANLLIKSICKVNSLVCEYYVPEVDFKCNYRFRE